MLSKFVNNVLFVSVIIIEIKIAIV